MKHILYIFLFLYYNTNQANNLENTLVTEEVFLKKTSSVFYIKNDSLIEFKYNQIIELLEKENYASGLEKALVLKGECEKDKNVYWTYNREQ